MHRNIQFVEDPGRSAQCVRSEKRLCAIVFYASDKILVNQSIATIQQLGGQFFVVFEGDTVKVDDVVFGIFLLDFRSGGFCDPISFFCLPEEPDVYIAAFTVFGHGIIHAHAQSFENEYTDSFPGKQFRHFYGRFFLPVVPLTDNFGIVGPTQFQSSRNQGFGRQVAYAVPDNSQNAVPGSHAIDFVPLRLFDNTG